MRTEACHAEPAVTVFTAEPTEGVSGLWSPLPSWVPGGRHANSERRVECAGSHLVFAPRTDPIVIPRVNRPAPNLTWRAKYIRKLKVHIGHAGTALLPSATARCDCVFGHGTPRWTRRVKSVRDQPARNSPRHPVLSTQQWAVSPSGAAACAVA